MMITGRTRIDLPRVNMTLASIAILEQVCIMGLPNPLTAELADALTELVCKTINPMRPLIEFEESK